MGAKISLKTKALKMAQHKKERIKEKVQKKMQRNRAKNKRNHISFA